MIDENGKEYHNQIRFKTIIEKLAILEGRISPQDTKPVDSKQKKPALFNNLKKDESAVPMVGGVEFAENKMAEDVLARVRASLDDYLKSAEEKIEDADIKEKKREDRDLKKKEKHDRDLIAKVKPIEEEGELDAALSGVLPAQQPPGEEGVSIKESAPIKTITNECGIWEMHGNEHDGFEIRRLGRSLPSRFTSLDEAEMALEMFAHRQRMADESQDYIDEA